ncbi:membrane protein insertase YidC [Bacillaceae bacterium IKA-2]|nr:membrane protein insertase YidC [Bacillaceae bacterium IKA-2]
MKNKHVFFFILGLGIFLTGCGVTTEPIDENTTGFFSQYLVYPFSYLIKVIAEYFNGNYGVSIILMTILVRLCIMPMMLKQSKNQISLKEKMAVIQPEIDKIKKKYEGKNDKQIKEKIQQETIEVYSKFKLNPLSSLGCLPMLIQLPILMGFYLAIMRTSEIGDHSFLWFSLGEANVLLALIAAVIYFLQFQTTQLGIETQQGQGMIKMMGYLSPILIGVFSLTLPAALPLYWTVGGIFLILQTFLSKYLYQSQPKTALSISVKK